MSNNNSLRIDLLYSREALDVISMVVSDEHYKLLWQLVDNLRKLL